MPSLFSRIFKKPSRQANLNIPKNLNKKLEKDIRENLNKNIKQGQKIRFSVMTNKRLVYPDGNFDNEQVYIPIRNRDPRQYDNERKQRMKSKYGVKLNPRKYRNSLTENQLSNRFARLPRNRLFYYKTAPNGNINGIYLPSHVKSNNNTNNNNGRPFIKNLSVGKLNNIFSKNNKK